MPSARHTGLRRTQANIGVPHIEWLAASRDLRSKHAESFGEPEHRCQHHFHRRFHIFVKMPNHNAWQSFWLGVVTRPPCPAAQLRAIDRTATVQPRTTTVQPQTTTVQPLYNPVQPPYNHCTTPYNHRTTTVHPSQMQIATAEALFARGSHLDRSEHCLRRREVFLHPKTFVMSFRSPERPRRHC